MLPIRSLLRTLFAAALAVLLMRCQSLPATAPIADAASRPPPSQPKIVRLFKDTDAAEQRDRSTLPAHYLELYDANVRNYDCMIMMRHAAAAQGAGGESSDQVEDCKQRLQDLADQYFGAQAGPDDIGLALEGGGSKSAPFSMGIVAGFVEQGELFKRVTAISSVSGGTYATSYFYQRLLDMQRGVPQAGDPGDWYASCIPDYYLYQQARLYEHEVFPHADFFGPLLAVDPTIAQMRCGEFRKIMGNTHCPATNVVKIKRPSENCEEEAWDGKPPYNQFAEAYAFQGQVWINHDLLMGDKENGLQVKVADVLFTDLPEPQVINTLELFGNTLLSLPYDALARTVFHWPANIAPSMAAYKKGLLRQYGLSPYAWECRQYPAKCDDPGRTLEQPRLLSDLQNLTLYGRPAPQWIVNAAAPSDIGAASWLRYARTDPIRHTFELTADRYGSGWYGYALGPVQNSEPFTIVDAVAASGGFFDDDQTKIDTQPLRLIANAAQHFTNISWYTEIPDFSATPASREWNAVTPWPFYMTSEPTPRPYIHLQDGGNAENTGIFSLLRRGYHHILFAHGGDNASNLNDLCHLKNYLELDGAYRLEGRQFDEILTGPDGKPDQGDPKQADFATYLDQLCTLQLAQSDSAVYSDAVINRLICARYHHNRDSGDDCSEAAFFWSGNWARAPYRWPYISDLFHHWAGGPVEFIVARNATPGGPGEKTIASIIMLAAALDQRDFLHQLTYRGGDVPAGLGWAEFCDTAGHPRHDLQVRSCRGPGNKIHKLPGAPDPVLPCNALGYLLVTSCDAEPAFPQDNFAFQTWHSDYIQFAAYFDLARNLVWRAVPAMQDWDKPNL